MERRAREIKISPVHVCQMLSSDDGGMPALCFFKFNPVSCKSEPSLRGTLISSSGLLSFCQHYRLVKMENWSQVQESGEDLPE